MPKESIAWAEDSPVFEVVHDSNSSVPAANVHIIGWYPRDKDPLLSGWLLGGERIKGKAALVEVTMGKGRIILLGFGHNTARSHWRPIPCSLTHFANRRPLVTPFDLMGVLFWDRRRPRLHSLRLANLRGNIGRRGRLMRSQKSTPIRSKGVTKREPAELFRTRRVYTNTRRRI